MPGRKSSGTKQSAAPKAGAADSGDPAGESASAAPESEPTTPEAQSAEAELAEAEPMNRAERRAKGRKGAAVTTGKVNLPGRGSGPVAAPRQWTKRRSG